MEWWISIFGEGKELTALQMSARAVVVFVMALVMLRVTGQRTFGNKSAVDNVVMIVLGAILSRGITGSSPFIPVICASFAIVLFHRFLSWTALFNKTMARWIKGSRVSLYSNGKQHKANMRKTLVSHDDVMEAVHLQTNTDSVENIAQIYMEACGEMSVIKKDEMA